MYENNDNSIQINENTNNTKNTNKSGKFRKVPESEPWWQLLVNLKASKQGGMLNMIIAWDLQEVPEFDLIVLSFICY